MFEFITLFFADRYMKLPNSQKRHKLLRLENADRILKKAFKWFIFASIILCVRWDIYEIVNGSEIYGIVDVFIECLIYPTVLWFIADRIRSNKFGFIAVMVAVLFAMLWHTPTYSFMIVWCIAFVTVRFMLSGMQTLTGYPDFHDDLRGKKAEELMTEDQRFAVFQSDVKSKNKIIWHDEQEKQHTAEDILSGRVDIDGYYGVRKCENPGVMDELVIPDDLDLEDGECYKNS